MKRTRTFGALLAVTFLLFVTSNKAADLPWKPELKLVAMAAPQGSFVSSQAIYADSERIFAGSYEGDLFVFERDRETNFPLIETIALGSCITAVRGDEDNVYVTGRNGNFYVFTKTWPLLLSQSIPLSDYGLASLEVVGTSVYVAKGQAAMTASKSRVYLSGLNPGDIGLDLTTMRSFANQFQPDTTLVFDRQTLQTIGAIPNSDRGAMRVSAWQDFIYLTKPGCCGVGIDIYDTITLKRVQFINRTTNAVAGIKRKGVPLLVGGSETGAVDLYALGTEGYRLVHTADLRELTGFGGIEDIEIRALWVDGLDNLVFAGSSWGNERSRSAELPSLFVLEIR
jgi:hypothetical protein